MLTSAQQISIKTSTVQMRLNGNQ